MGLAMRALLIIAGVAFGALVALPAKADAIDGAWCREDLRLTINGPAITTPAGTRTSGDYSRHAFSYVVPASEPDAGTTISMRLLNEETMNLRSNLEAPWQTWRRCGPPIS
jgi:hypothetical protein